MAALGDCFHAAFMFLTDNRDLPGVTLVHGKPLGTGPIAGQRFRHAWIEVGDVVIDPANGSCDAFRREQYYEVGRIEQAVKYSVEEAVKLALETEHSGPWESREQW